MRYFAIAFALLAGPAMAQCPDPDLNGPTYASSGPDLLAPKMWPASAGGSVAAPCEEWQAQGIVTGNLDGFLPVAPTAAFELDTLGPHILQVRAVAECQPVLAVRSGDGLWHFGETKNGKEEVTLWGAPDGLIQVWVGAATPDGCDASIELETYDR